jgi:hypothetical protein
MVLMNGNFPPAIQPVQHDQLSPLGLPVHPAEGVSPVAPAAQDPFGINRAEQADKFAAISAQSTSPNMPSFSAPVETSSFNFKAPTAEEVAKAEHDEFMNVAKAAARKAIDATVGYDTQAALQASIDKVNTETEAQRVTAAAQLEQSFHVQRVLDEETSTGKKDKKPALVG